MKSALALAAGLLTATIAWSSTDAPTTPAEAEERRKAISALIKSKGPATAGGTVMAADDPLKCKYKDMVCMVLDMSNGTFLAHTAMPRLAGQKYDVEMVDVDGVNITEQQVGPAKQGKTVWEAKWKFARPDTRKITPRWATCEKADASRVVCVSIAQP